MKVVILAGGLGTRLTEETAIKPKPMVEIGGHPIIWHIMKHYSHYDFKEFFVALGYRGEILKRFFLDYYNLNGNMTVDFSRGKVETRDQEYEDWVVHLVDTGDGTQTGGRIKRLEPMLKNETFMVTYGDGVCNLDLRELLKFHRAHGRIATVTAVRPPARFGGLIFDGDIVTDFTEKPQIGEGWINGGFLVFEPALFDYLDGDETVLESGALERLAADGQLAAFRHERFWQCMDTLRDKHLLETLWQERRAPWKVWD
ncbi:MAG TPA: glucose-1-phosphate cytidylyltransferase [Pyrinomonadaceae bacterium]|jgi:glucose-1-phosphate cytidylyltransferase|nr:glucose-1-phosphate cytidylyltransferase [Pyrinomonadaceae bacterium]